MVSGLLGLNQNVRVVLLLDEIERLCPPSKITEDGGESRSEILRFFSVLRKLKQENLNFGLAIGGLASGSVERSVLFGGDNPLFAFATPTFLRPFDQAESERLLNGLGQRAGLRWVEDGIRAAFHESGGHPLLLREMASAVLSKEPHARVTEVVVTNGRVARVSDEWKRAVSGKLREVTEHLRRYYIDDWELLVGAMESQENFSEWMSLYPEQAGRLAALGMLDPAESANEDWVPSKLLEISWKLAAVENRPKGKPTWAELAKRSLDQLTLLQEGELLEFKSSALVPTERHAEENSLIDEIVREVLGFMNSDGGVILIGVRDDGFVLGLDPDLARAGSADKLHLRLQEKIRSAVGEEYAPSVSISMETTGIQTVCRIVVPPSPQPVWSLSKLRGGDQDVLFVREGPSVRPRKGRAQNEWIQCHFGR